MKSSISLMLFVICTVVLAAQQSQAKKGCQAYGHVCYGGHGKRSLWSSVKEQREYLHSNGLPVAMLDVNYKEYPREFLIKIIKSWFDHPERINEQLSELDYPNSAEGYRNKNLNSVN